ncbi:hypothetical protein Pmani_013438 [Petrolisthes manimaculis]|uniref:Uncharacterized protein n=1 Tax=Petrolisthes manimaculis TaxID=1843537 RepID=A0AAE1U9L9_9EUCA|nr:hypothetical protein Pmani_013438 [Petrolisthes manimaculis]
MEEEGKKKGETGETGGGQEGRKEMEELWIRRKEGRNEVEDGVTRSKKEWKEGKEKEGRLCEKDFVVVKDIVVVKDCDVKDFVVMKFVVVMMNSIVMKDIVVVVKVL